jgi:hypothetical protein
MVDAGAAVCLAFIRDSRSSLGAAHTAQLAGTARASPTQPTWLTIAVQWDRWA